MCRSVGSPVIAKSPRQPSRISASVERSLDVLGLLVGHADEAARAPRPAAAASRTAHIIAASAPFMS